MHILLWIIGNAQLISKSHGTAGPRESSTSKQTPPTAQIPPAHTPLERSGTMEEDTLANVQSLPPEKSEAPEENKQKKKEKSKKKK